MMVSGEGTLDATFAQRELRPSWVEIDLAALAHNVALMKAAVGQTVKVFAVCKADAYGCGAAVVADVALKAGADAIAVGSPTDAMAVRRAGISAPILLYACSLPADEAAVLDLNVMPTLHTMQALRSLTNLRRAAAVYVKVDTGFDRLGFAPPEWELAFSELAQNRHVELAGIYTHFYSPEDAATISTQVQRFKEACRLAEAAGFKGFDRMVASSRVIAMHPELNLTAVNPGRALYGLWDDSWSTRLGTAPVIVGVKARAIQVGEIPSGTGRYDAASLAPRPHRVAVIPLGHADGLPQDVRNAAALVSGRPVRLLSTHLEHTVIDVSEVLRVEVGDEVVLLGQQGSATITAEAFAASYSMSMLELVTRLAGTLARKYLQ